MKIISYFRYEVEGKILIFTEAIPRLPTDQEQMYIFTIDGDEALAKKLAVTVRLNRITYQTIPSYAEILCENIERNWFTPLYTEAQIQELYQKFQKDQQCSPVFKINTQDDTKILPKYNAEITNGIIRRFGIGKTIAQAKADALQKYFDYLKR